MYTFTAAASLRFGARESGNSSLNATDPGISQSVPGLAQQVVIE